MADHVTDTNFDSAVLQSAIPVLIDFWAPWCGPCRALTPVIDELATEFAGKVNVVKVNVDESPLTAGKYNIRTIPTLILIKNGETIKEVKGGVSKHTIKEMLAQVAPA